MDNQMSKYVRLIESAGDYKDDLEDMDKPKHDHEPEYVDECECDEEEEVLENDDADDRVEEVLSEDGAFWENFGKDVEFEIEENNGMYCIRGDETGFHYGSHVDYDCAVSHQESLKNYQE